MRVACFTVCVAWCPVCVVCSFAVTMKRHLRGERELTELCRLSVLSVEQVSEIRTAKHMPLIVLEKLSACVRSAKQAGLLTDIEAMALDAVRAPPPPISADDLRAS